jgi:DnaJ-domain-containing protein 1
MGKITINGLIKRIFSENKEIIKNHMKKENITLKTVHEEIENILYLLKWDNILLEKENEGAFQIKDALEYLPVKLGYFKIENISGEANNPERRVEQCPIIPTDKGKAVYSQYKQLKSN